MFPNVRLMIVAIMASIVGMSCGLGVFAAFRVNYDPFVQRPTGAPPLHLVFGNAAPASLTDAAAAPFGVRFEMPTPRTGDSQTPQPVSATGRETVSAPPQGSVYGPAGEAVAPLPSPAAEGPDTARNPMHGAAQAALAPPGEPSSPDAKPGQDGKIAPQAVVPARAKAAAEPARTVSKRQRVAAKPRRARKLRARAVTQPTELNSGYAQPSYQFTPAAQAAPARSRRAVRNSVNNSTSQ